MNLPTAPPDTPRGRRPWRRRRLLLALIAVTILLVGFVVVTGYRFLGAHRELAAALAETDRLDPGWRLEDLETQRQLPPDEQNAALQVLLVHSLLPRPWPSRPSEAEDEDPDSAVNLYTLPPERQLTERQIHRLRADLERAGPALTQARKLADMPEGRYRVAWTPDLDSTTCPWSDAMWSTPELLHFDILLLNQNENPDAALLSARALLNMGRSLGDEPFWYGPGHRNACRRNAARAIERTLAQGQPSERMLTALQESIGREEAVPLLLPYLRGHRATLHIFLTRVDRGQNRISELNDYAAGKVETHVETWFGRVKAVHIHARFLRGMSEAVEIAKLPLEQQWPRLREWRPRWEQVENVGDEKTLDIRGEDRYLTGHAILRCTLAALAAERYRRQHGDWPRAIADLVPDYLPAVPLDPFDGQPLRFLRTERGLAIYSVGADGRDDDGDVNSSPEWGPRDVVFTLWDVGHRRQPPQPPAPLAEKPDTGRDS